MAEYILGVDPYKPACKNPSAVIVRILPNDHRNEEPPVAIYEGRPPVDKSKMMEDMMKYWLVDGKPLEHRPGRAKRFADIFKSRGTGPFIPPRGKPNYKLCRKIFSKHKHR